MKSFKTIILGIFLSVIEINAQCPFINCPIDIVMDNDSASCDAVVAFTWPYAVDTCQFDSMEFNYSGVIDTFVVPAGIYNVHIKAWGASGGNSTWGSIVYGGLGAYMRGDFAVTPGQVLLILAGQQGESAAVGGGGGASFVVDSLTALPLIVAGAGGGASSDQNGVNAVTTQDGTMDSQNLIPGGTSGNGGSVCSPGISGNSGGGGAGFFTNGQDVNPGSAPDLGGFGGAIFYNGAAGGIPGRLDGACPDDPYGGFGGGGSATCNTVGGGGGAGYSGGAGGPHIGNCGAGLRSGGGGGGSYNIGTNQVNIAGNNTGNGKVVITFFKPLAITQIAGLSSGSSFPIGITTQTFVTADSIIGNMDTCSFTIAVNDTVIPQFNSCLSDISSCNPLISGIAPPSVTDNCATSITYSLSGATTGAGTGDVSGTTFNIGTTNVSYVASDSSGLSDTCTFIITIVDCSGIYSNENIIISSYPIPTENILSLTLGKEYIDINIQVLDLSGKAILTGRYGNMDKITIDLTTLSSGTYLVMVNTELGQNVVRVIRR